MKKDTIVKLVGVFLPLITVGLIAVERLGAWDWYYGLNEVLEVAERFDQSYTPHASRPLRPNETAWMPMLRLIRRYSTADLPPNRTPKVLARSVAVASNKIDFGNGQIAEWTAPSTPIALIYIDWPGNTVSSTDYRFVGTIGDIRQWVENERSRIHFWMQDVLLSIITVCLGLTAWRYENNVKEPLQKTQSKSD